MTDRLFPLSDPLSPRQLLYLRMVDWLLRIPDGSLEWAKEEAAKFARHSLDPQRDLDMMRGIEDFHETGAALRTTKPQPQGGQTT